MRAIDPAVKRARAYAYRRAWLAEKRKDPTWVEAARVKGIEKTRLYRAAQDADPARRRARLDRRQDIRNGAVLERVVESHLTAGVIARGGFCPKFKDLGQAGAPDRIVVLPGHPVYFVELKRPKGGWLEPHQKRYHLELTSRGQRVWVLYTVEAVDAFFAEIGV